MNELTFDVDGGGLRDVTLHRIELTTPAGPVALVIARREADDSASLEAAVDGQLRREQAAVLGFREIGRRSVRVGRNEGIETKLRYRSGDAEGYQIDAHFLRDGVLFRVGATSRMENRAATEACLHRVLETLSFNE